MEQKYFLKYNENDTLEVMEEYSNFFTAFNNLLSYSTGINYKEASILDFATNKVILSLRTLK